MSTKLVPFLICAALAGCAGTATYSGSVAYTSTAPDMVYVSDGVRVIADYDEPIFFANGYYWYNTNGYWELVKHESGLPWESSLYVPKILAAAIVGRNLGVFGFAEVTPDPPFAGDEVEVPAGTTLAAVARGRRVERWQRIAVASAKQCGRATVPPILEPRLFSDVPAALGRLALPGPGLMFVEPSAAGGAIALGDLDSAAPHETTVLIGPEGGWTPEEIELASAACRLVTLGSRTLRADAMAVVAMAALLTRWREL